MTSKSNRLLKLVATCSATIVAFSGPAFKVQANTRSPNRLAGSVTIRQEGDRIQINYPASQSQRVYPIYHAVWSDENGQDDIFWHRADPQSTTFNLSQHQGQGIYHAHTYIKIDGQMVLLNATTFQVSRPLALTSALTVPQSGILEVRVNQAPQKYRELLLPTWSEARGQDDIRWYRVSRGSDGSFTLRINLADHQSALGKYHVHIYGVNQQTSGQDILAGQSFDVTAQHLPKTNAIAPQFRLQDVDGNRGRYQVQVTDSGRLVQSASLAVWSTGNQSNIKWYALSADGQGGFKASVDIANHQQLAGFYHSHLYMTYRDGSRTSHALDLVDFTNYRQPPANAPNPGQNYQNVSRETNTYPIGECTWGVKELAPWVGNYWGNARDWYTTAQGLGFEVGTEPRVGAVAVWPEDGNIGGQTYGHVAVVTQVDTDTRIQVEEANYAGNRYVANFRGWFDPYKIWKGGRYVDSTVYYIYPKA